MKNYQFYFMNSALISGLFGTKKIGDKDSSLEFSYVNDAITPVENGIHYDGTFRMVEHVYDLPDSEFSQDIAFNASIVDFDPICVEVVIDSLVSRSLKGEDYDGLLKIDDFLTLPHDDIEYSFNCKDLYITMKSGRVLHISSLNDVIEVYSDDLSSKVSYELGNVSKDDIDYDEIDSLTSLKKLTFN